MIKRNAFAFYVSEKEDFRKTWQDLQILADIDGVKFAKYVATILKKKVKQREDEIEKYKMDKASKKKNQREGERQGDDPEC